MNPLQFELACRTSVLVSEKLRHRSMSDRLSESTGQNIVLISDHRELTVANLRKLDPEFVFFPHWSRKISAEIYEEFECVMFHMTDLPFGRGGSPLQNLILRKVLSTKLCAFRCVEEIDGGPIYLRSDLDLVGSASEILDRASVQIEMMIKEILILKPKPVEQFGEILEFKRRVGSDSNLLHCERYSDLFDFIRMMDDDDYPRSFLETGCARLEFSEVVDEGAYLEARVRIFPRQGSVPLEIESDPE